MSSVAKTKVRRFEGKIRVKGFKIAYVVWIPDNSTVFDVTSFDATESMRIDPITMTNYFEETIVCFHGWLDNANSYAKLGPLMANKFKNMRVIGIDLPGHGKSSHSLIGYYDATLYITTMLRVLHRLRIRAFHLMGHSLSAVFLPYLTPVLESSGKFYVKSLICIEQFGAMRNSINIKSVKIDQLLPTFQDEKIDKLLQESEDGDDIEIDNNDNEISTKKLPKLYGSVDELVRSRIYVTEQVYPGQQTIAHQSAKLILQRNVGKVIVVESHTRKKKIKYFLRFDPKLKNGTNTFRNILCYDMPKMSKNVIGKIKCPMLGVFGDSGWPHLDLVAKNVEKLGLTNLQILRMNGSHHLHADEPEKFLENITPFLQNAIEKFKNDHPNMNGNGNGHSKL